MAQKKLQKGSAWEQADLDGDGIVTDGELAMTAKIEQLQHQREMNQNLDKMQDQQRLMAWVAMGSMVLFTHTFRLYIGHSLCGYLLNRR